LVKKIIKLPVRLDFIQEVQNLSTIVVLEALGNKLPDFPESKIILIQEETAQLVFAEILKRRKHGVKQLKLFILLVSLKFSVSPKKAKSVFEGFEVVVIEIDPLLISFQVEITRHFFTAKIEGPDEVRQRLFSYPLRDYSRQPKVDEDWLAETRTHHQISRLYIAVHDSQLMENC
jgi:hypothetical protein